MTDLIIVCRNKNQAIELYRRTLAYLAEAGRNPKGLSKNILLVRDTVSNDTARFITMHEIRHKHVDDGLRGVRISGDHMDRWLEHQELDMYKKLLEESK